MNETEAKRLVAESGRMLLAEGLAARTWGNISCRTGDLSMVITPSGLAYEGMTPEDIVSLDIATGEWRGTRKPSSEKSVHTAAYRAFGDAGFVIHTHQTFASAIGLGPLSSLSLTVEEASSLGGVGLAGYGLPGTKKLAGNIAEAFGKGAHTVLMVHHGAVIAGKDRAEAFERAHLLEEVCRRSWKGPRDDSLSADSGTAQRLTDAVKSRFGHAACTAAAPVFVCAAGTKAVPAQLDDMAQMIGHRIDVVPAKEQAVLQKLEKGSAVLVRGVGAICRASDDGDLKPMCSLIEKACICFLHTQASGIDGRLSWLDTQLMRTVYLKKYSQKIRG